MDTIKQIAEKYKIELNFLGAYISADGSIFVSKKKTKSYYTNPQVEIACSEKDYIDNQLLPVVNKIPYLKISIRYYGRIYKGSIHPMYNIFFYPARYVYCLFSCLNPNPVMKRKFEILEKCYGSSEEHIKRFDDWFIYQQHHSLSYGKVSSMLKGTTRWAWDTWKKRYKTGAGYIPGN